MGEALLEKGIEIEGETATVTDTGMSHWSPFA